MGQEIPGRTDLDPAKVFTYPGFGNAALQLLRVDAEEVKRPQDEQIIIFHLKDEQVGEGFMKCGQPMNMEKSSFPLK